MKAAAEQDLADLDKLWDLHRVCQKNGVDEVSLFIVTKLGGIPKSWDHSGGAGIPNASAVLKKLPANDPALLARIQKLVDETFWGFGTNPRPVTRDRRSGNLCDRLKVEQIIKVENAMNYISFGRRRTELKKLFEKLPDSEKDFAKWDIKTRRVSMTEFEGDTPIDPTINEAWFWHGTTPAGANGITSDDFLLSKAGSAAGTLYGRGLYFAESCMKADEYSMADPTNGGLCPFLLCRVALGRIHYCDDKNPNATSLEETCRKGVGHHEAVLGDREKIRGTFREFIVFDSHQVYPEFLVWCKRIY